MKQLIIFCLISLISACSNTDLKTSKTSTEAIGSASENHNIIFKYAPQGEDSLITFKALQHYKEKYENVAGFKSFAQAEDGSWAYVTHRESQEIANGDALKSCENYNLKFTIEYPCKLVNISGQWVNSQNQVVNILKSLPKFTPLHPIDQRQLRVNSTVDMENKDYKAALAKRIWFHQHVLDIDDNLNAVRLSYGLSSWSELGKQYPPAKTMMRYAANYAKTAFMKDSKDSFNLIREYVSINRELERTDQSISLFKWLDKKHPELASEYFHLFKDALTDHKEFTLYNEYLTPDINYNSIASSYLYMRNAVENGSFGTKEQRQQMYKSEINSFINNVSRLTAILMINGRADEAQTVVQKAQLQLESDKLNVALDNALKGILPK